jgi:hypothetical protein
MKKIQFALDEDKYHQVKTKLQATGLTWQTVCEQMTDYLIYAEELGEFGIPLQEMSPSILKKAKSEIEGHFETASQKYIQIHLDYPRDRNHWVQALKAALKNVIKSNSSKSFKRGYFFDQDELNDIFKEMWDYGVRLAAGHLGLEKKEIKVKKPSLDELFEYAGVPLNLKKDKI